MIKKIYYIIFPFIITSMIGLLLYLGAEFRAKTYLNFQNKLAQKSVKAASNELNLYLSELRRSVRLFADQQSLLLQSLSVNKSDQVKYNKLARKIALYFPEYFTFTITTQKGVSILEGLDNFVGKGCRKDLVRFSKHTESHHVYVHSSPFKNPYHFDVMVPWGNNKGIFFVSFNLKNITHILRNSETIGHNLILLKKDKHGLVEVTSHGSFKSLKNKKNLSWFVDQASEKKKDNFRLSHESLKNIETESVVPGTLWTLVDIPNNHLYKNMINKIRIQHGFIFIIFCLVLFAMIFYIYQANKKLVLTLSQLQIANDQKNKLFSIIAHDLRNPFTPIKSLANLLIKNAASYGPEEIVKRAKMIGDSSDRALDLLEKLLDWARLQIGGREIISERVNVKEIAMKTIELYSVIALEKNCILKNEVESFVILADNNAIDTLLRNLVSNAIKFTKSGCITIGSEDLGDKVKIFVKDTGVGMDEDLRRKIFDDANYITTYGTAGEKGTGLGLCICKDLVQKLKGQIDVESRVGEGSTFYFILSKK